ncbi:MAG: CHRD domain-containing protein [Acidobacteria bacterium]|nr:CHRD domain-containing protein [Acidobacteriota bacterium]
MRHIYMRGMVIVAALLMLAPGAAAQTEEKFKLRLTPVPLDGGMRATVTGSGSGSATLSGAKLAINGTFDGLKSPATIAKIHRGVATGVRGSAFLDLTVTKAMNGTFSGTFDLNPEQVDSLKKGKLYIQIHSEKAPEGNLWGWLLK